MGYLHQAAERQRALLDLTEQSKGSPRHHCHIRGSNGDGCGITFLPTAATGTNSTRSKKSCQQANDFNEARDSSTQSCNQQLKKRGEGANHQKAPLKKRKEMVGIKTPAELMNFIYASAINHDITKVMGQ
jgi:hypothetical protein